jgi:hypothetical protein
LTEWDLKQEGAVSCINSGAYIPHHRCGSRCVAGTFNFQLRQGKFSGLPRPEINFALIVLAVGDGNNMEAVPF